MRRIVIFCMLFLAIVPVTVMMIREQYLSMMAFSRMKELEFQEPRPNISNAPEGMEDLEYIIPPEIKTQPTNKIAPKVDIIKQKSWVCSPPEGLIQGSGEVKRCEWL